MNANLCEICWMNWMGKRSDPVSRKAQAGCWFNRGISFQLVIVDQKNMEVVSIDGFQLVID